jgi:hypothetical protein
MCTVLVVFTWSFTSAVTSNSNISLSRVSGEEGVIALVHFKLDFSP